ncbi:unnamed protein product, partial [Iphiclides podalirius]
MLKNPLYVYGKRGALKIPAHFHYGELLLQRFGGYGDQAAVINAETGQSLTFRQLVQQSVDIALSLVRIGVRKGEVVGVCSEKRIEFIPTVLGVICAGATYTGVDVTGGRATILHRTELAKPSVLFCSPSAYEVHRETIKSIDSLRKVIIFEGGEREWDDAVEFSQFLTETAPVEDFQPIDVEGWSDVAIILYSSGTTGLPKGIPLTHLNLLLFLGDTGDKSPYANTKTLITREWYYSYGLMHTLFTLYMGSTVMYCPSGDLRHYLEAIQSYKIDVIQVAPSTVSELLYSSLVPHYDLSSLVCLISCSTTLSAELGEAVKARFPNLGFTSQYYGMSEAGCICSDRRAPKGQKPGSVGCVTEAFTIKVVDLNTRLPLGPKQRGEICFKSLSLMPGYIGDKSLDYLDEEGCFKTGDIGYYDEDRYFYIVGRIKELIKFNSYQVAPAELDAVLAQHPAVLKAGVVGAPHDEYGEVPTAFVVLRPGYEATAQELVDYVDGQVSYRMRLAGGVRFVDDLPTVSTGKLDRKKLKAILTEGR